MSRIEGLKDLGLPFTVPPLWKPVFQCIYDMNHPENLSYMGDLDRKVRPPPLLFYRALRSLGPSVAQRDLAGQLSSLYSVW